MAICAHKSDFCGGKYFLTIEAQEEDLQALLVGKSKGPNRRGRPTLLGDQEIFARREEFAKVFSALWGEIGWKLERCKTEADVSKALVPLNQVVFIRPLASIFFDKFREASTIEEIRTLRIELNNVLHVLQAVDGNRQKLHEEAARMDAALAQFQNKRRLIKKELRKAWKELSELKRKWLDLSQRHQALKDQLRSMETGFALQQVLDFCASGRYELNPLNLANAIAGLPYIGWRQSMRRTVKQTSEFENTLEFQIFKAIRFISKDANKGSQRVFIAEFREAVLRLPARHLSAKHALAEKWFYLERAIQRAFRTKVHPRILPFEISKHYFRQFRSLLSQADFILAERARLKLRS